MSRAQEGVEWAWARTHARDTEMPDRTMQDRMTEYMSESMSE
jgi:hypothetical protein